MSAEDVIAAVDDLARRLPAERATNTLAALEALAPAHGAAIRATIDAPLAVRVCPETSREFVCCAYNRCGPDTYRSPWAESAPCGGPSCAPCGDSPCASGDNASAATGPGAALSASTRDLERTANEAFATYCAMYYEGGATASAYFWPTAAPPAFAGAVVVKKDAGTDSHLRMGTWDAVHLVEAAPVSPEAWTYRVTTTVTLVICADAGAALDALTLSGSITHQAERTVPLASPNAASHVAAIGALVEDAESRLRSSLQEVHFGRAHDLVNEIRPVLPPGYLRHQSDLAREMAERLALRRRG